MIIEHYKASDLTTNNWSGGTTTQLAIYPKDADYKKRNFLFRISTATVEAEESVFTKLPLVSRKLMILDSEIKIEHKNNHTKTIKKFEQDEFSGDWYTKSYGKATDFNLMTIGDVKGEIEAITHNDSKKIIIEKNIDCYAFYIYSGSNKLLLDNKSVEVNKGDLFMLFPEQAESTIELITSMKSEIILTKIQLNK
jgi:environmental stress-induced protein Ves